MRLPAYYGNLIVLVLVLACISDVLASHRFAQHHGGFHLEKRRAIFQRRSASSWLTSISSSISDWMFGSVKAPAKDESNRPKALNGGPPVLKRMLYPYVTGMVPRPANETLAGTGLAASWLCMTMDAPAAPAPAPASQQSTPAPATASDTTTGASGGVVPGAGTGVAPGSVAPASSFGTGAGSVVPAGTVPASGTGLGTGPTTPIYNGGAGGGVNPVGAGAGTAVASNAVPAGYVIYYGQLITYQEYQQILASQAQPAMGGTGLQPVTPATNSNPTVPAGYVYVNGQLITQQQYAQLLGQAGVGATTPGVAGTAGTTGLAGTAGTTGLAGTAGTTGLAGTAGTTGLAGTAGVAGTAGTAGTVGSIPGSGLPSGFQAGTGGVTPGGVSSPGTVQKRDSLAKRQTPGTAGSAGGDGTATAATAAQIMVCVNGDLDVAPIKFDTMTGVRIVDTAASTDGVMDITNLPNYKMPWMPFLPTQAMWDEQQILMLAQEHQIQYSTNTGPPPTP